MVISPFTFFATAGAIYYAEAVLSDDAERRQVADAVEGFYR